MAMLRSASWATAVCWLAVLSLASGSDVSDATDPLLLIVPVVSGSTATTMVTSADPLAARTVVRNLVDNAVKATAAAGGGTVIVQAGKTDGGVRLEVRDNGLGFQPQEAGRLFEKFYRPGDELRRKSPGSGLGLFIVKGFMQLERGRVDARSDGPGKGAVFSVSWPAAGETT